MTQPTSVVSDSSPTESPVHGTSVEAKPGGLRFIRQSGLDSLFGRLAVSKATGHRLLAAGKIGPRSIKVGGCVRYDLEEVERWLANRRPDNQLHDAQTWPAVWEAICLQKGGRMEPTKDGLIAEELSPQRGIKELEAEVERLKVMYESACGRIAAQSELLSRKAER